MTIYFVFLCQFGRTPLHLAVAENKVEVVRLLIMAGAQTNIPNKVMICFIIIKQTTNMCNQCNTVEVIKKLTFRNRFTIVL